MTSDLYRLTQAGKSDIPFIVTLRMQMFAENGIKEHSMIDGARELLMEWYSKEYGRGTMAHFVAWGPDNHPASIAGALIKDDYPHSYLKPGYYGWIMDVYTIPSYRNKGLATRLITRTQQWLLSKGAYEAKLAALDQRGSWFLEKLGYRSTREVSINLLKQTNCGEFLCDSAKL